MNVPTAQQLLEQLKTMLGADAKTGAVTLEFRYETVAEAREAKRLIVQKQRELRNLRRESNAAKTATRSTYTARKVEVSSILTGFLFGRGAARHNNAIKREGLRREAAAAA